MMMAPPKQISRDDVEKAATFLHDRAYEYESGDPVEAKRLNPIKRELTATAAMLRSLWDRVEELEAVVCVSRDALRQCPAETLEHRRDINIAKRACVEALAETDQ